MGIPAFFMWLTKKYPRIVVDVVEEAWREINGAQIPPDTSQKNPNGVEYDCLYLDMNGIIHPCFHPENKEQPKDEEEVLENIYRYIDRIFAIVRPRRLLYMAIDGVAPRAKMNQQRSRRFRAAKEARDKALAEQKTREDLVAQGLLSADQAREEEEAARTKSRLDSNVITPGTEFMHKVSQGLQGYVAQRQKSEPGWQNIAVVLSDANVPGEGEHKIMDFIRHQRHQPGYDANTHHVLYGLDADLIMLALATHEPHFDILREVVTLKHSNNCHRCGQAGHFAAECVAVLEPHKSTAEGETRDEKQVPYQFLHVNVLREYLANDLRIDLPFPYEFERVIDDYVFLCFFVGNDFLPHLPTLEIREGAIDLLTEIYRSVLPSLGGYLTHDGDVHLDRVQRLLEDLAPRENQILAERRQREKQRKQNAKRRKISMSGSQEVLGHIEASVPLPRYNTQQLSAPVAFPAGNFADVLGKVLPPLGSQPVTPVTSAPVVSSSLDSNKNAAKMLKAAIDNALTLYATSQEQGATPVTSTPVTETPVTQPGTESTEPSPNRGVKRPREEEPEVDSDDERDPVRLGEEGWRERYYQNKFEVTLDDKQFMHDIRQSYIEGLVWVLRYYYQGCPSWRWFYKYHYAPFVAELVADGGVAEIDVSSVVHGGRYNQLPPPVLPSYLHDHTIRAIDIYSRPELDIPFTPFAQLMGVLPAASAKGVPEPYRRLMMDPESPIIDFYPENFVIDLNGKKHEWQGVALLPFIDEKRLLAAIEPVEKSLSPEEKRRNSIGPEMIFVSRDHAAAHMFEELYGLGLHKYELASVNVKESVKDEGVKDEPKNAETALTGTDLDSAISTQLTAVRSELDDRHRARAEIVHRALNSIQWSQVKSGADLISLAGAGKLFGYLSPSTFQVVIMTKLGLDGFVWCAQYIMPAVSEEFRTGLVLPVSEGESPLQRMVIPGGLLDSVRMPEPALTPYDLSRRNARRDRTFGRGGGADRTLNYHMRNDQDRGGHYSRGDYQGRGGYQSRGSYQSRGRDHNERYRPYDDYQRGHYQPEHRRHGDGAREHDEYGRDRRDYHQGSEHRGGRGGRGGYQARGDYQGRGGYNQGHSQNFNQGYGGHQSHNNFNQGYNDNYNQGYNYSQNSYQGQGQDFNQGQGQNYNQGYGGHQNQRGRGGRGGDYQRGRGHRY